jgi:hypothetical protein
MKVEFLEEESCCFGKFDIFLIDIAKDGSASDDGESVVDSVGVVIFESWWGDGENPGKFQQVFRSVKNLGSVIGDGRLIASTVRMM